MKRLSAVIGLIALASCQTANTASSVRVGPNTTANMIRGICGAAIISGRDLTRNCETFLVISHNAPSRQGATFSLSNGAAITLTGIVQSRTSTTASVAIDGVILNLGIPGVPPSTAPAKGRCLYRDTDQRGGTVVCVSDAGSQTRFSFLFNT